MNPSVAYCHVVASVLAADGRMDDSERTFLDALMTELGLNDDERNDVIHFENTDGAEDAVQDMPEEQRRRLMDDVLAAVLADGKISPLEQRLVQRLTEVLGL